MIGIIGAGPAGCALACFLAQKGIRCVVFDNQKRPELLVGESLVPAAIPYLQRLGIEPDVAAISAKKRGAALRHPSGVRVDFKFRRFSRDIPDYSYNIPRPEFDQILVRRAKSLGVTFINSMAELEPLGSDDRDIALSASCLKSAGLQEHPDFLVDATGRHRLFSRLLSLDAVKGKRNDVSYFAHYRNFSADDAVEGQVVLSVIDAGWSWQIPLKGVLSVGVVLDKKAAARYGSSPQERLENIIDNDAMLSISGRHRQRCSKVVTYSNYQLVTKQSFGKGWALLGDAHSFVDPMLSPGVFMALESAALLEKNLMKHEQIDYVGLERYSKELNHWHQSWNEVIDYFYDGRLLGLFEAGQNVAKNASKYSISRLLEWHIRRVISSMVSGAATRSIYNQKALFYSCQHLLSSDIDVERYRIKANRSNHSLIRNKDVCLG